MGKQDGKGARRGGAQDQGGIGPEAARRARDEAKPAGDMPRGVVDVPGPSLDDGDGDGADGRAHSGFTGDDGTHQASDGTAAPANLQTGSASDLGRARPRHETDAVDPAGRTGKSRASNDHADEIAEGGDAEADAGDGSDDTQRREQI